MRNRKILGLLLVIVAIGLGILVYFVAKDQWLGGSKESEPPSSEQASQKGSDDEKKIEESKKEINEMNDHSKHKKDSSKDNENNQDDKSQKGSDDNLNKRTEYFINNMFTNLNQENYQRIKNKLSTVCTPHFMHKYFRDKDSQYNFYMDVNISGFDIYESRRPRPNGKVLFATFERQTSPAHSGNTDIKPSHEEMTVQVTYKKVNGKMLVDEFDIQSNKDLDDTDESEETTE
ncbi:hypothetical protein [Staphylococcus sp. RIT622]|uniref:hypothetical protein n=1 Tax=Staphylococcus sp. RIT622 TaxID=2510795 RepID=UPI00101E6C3D|nr:hypothetical protein [Staphylococcus sp. RIT622]MCG2544228.1 hypothetical protein [Staphylococcus epidermidis]RYL09503.1 hypothetical protein EU553_11725 [Staphylococcus sp. RIT622]